MSADRWSDEAGNVEVVIYDYKSGRELGRIRAKTEKPYSPLAVEWNAGTDYIPETARR